MSKVLIVETTHGMKLRIPLEIGDDISSGGANIGVSCRVIDPDTETHIITLSVGFRAKELRVYAGQNEVWTNIPPHPFAGMSDYAEPGEFRPAEPPSEEELAQSNRAAAATDTINTLTDILKEPDDG